MGQMGFLIIQPMKFYANHKNIIFRGNFEGRQSISELLDAKSDNKPRRAGHNKIQTYLDYQHDRQTGLDKPVSLFDVSRIKVSEIG